MIEWRDIPGYEGFYQVSNFGSVVRLKRILPSLHEQGMRVHANELGQTPWGKGARMSVLLSANNIQKRFQVHRLVLIAFKGPAPEGMECRHLDGNHLNNWLGNLEWGTHTQNMNDKTGHGTQLIGTKHPKAKLTEDQVREIRAANATERALAEVYGVSAVSIHLIRARKTWKHVA